jgi:D-sedoheptulose 7-phosphate isomerase
VDASELAARVLRKHRESVATQEAFFTENAPRIAACASAVARALDAGGKLLVMGNGGSACDAQHLAVEFSHPVIEKRPALPAIALPVDSALVTAVGNDDDFALVFTKQIRLLGKAGDVAVGFSTSGTSSSVVRALRAARSQGLLTVGFAGRDGGRMVEACDHCLTVPSYSIHRIQETHVALLHVLWDLVHVARGEEDVL